MRRSLAVVSAIIALWACSNAQVRGTRSAVTQALPVTVCDFLKSPLAYRGRIVAITGVYWNGLRESCAEPLVTAGRAWPSAINLTTSQAAAQLGNPVPFETDHRSWEELDKTMIREAKAGLRGAIWVKITGQIRTLLGDNRVVGGYGHLGVFPAELVVERVSDIEIKSDPPYDYREVLQGLWEGGNSHAYNFIYGPGSSGLYREMGPKPAKDALSAFNAALVTEKCFKSDK